MKRHAMFAVVLAAALIAVAVMAPEAYAMVMALSFDPMQLDLGGPALLGLAPLMKAKQLREERAALHKKVAENLQAMDGADASRKKELGDENDRMFADIDSKKREIDQIERAADLESELSDRRGNLPAVKGVSDDPVERKEQQRLALEAYIRFGPSGLNDDARSIIMPRSDQFRVAISESLRHLKDYMRAEHRDLATTTSGAVIPNEYWQEIEKSMLAFGGMREVARTIRTATGGAFIMPTLNDTANKATLVTQAAQTTTSVDPTIASLQLDAFTYRSFMLVSREMLQDNAFDINSWVFGQDGLPTRLARGLNTEFTTGTGSNQPKGIAAATSSGLTMASSSDVAYNDFVDLEHSVDPAYRRNARWMFHDSLLKSAKKIKDSQNNPIWLSGLALRAPDTILGYPYQINQDVAGLSSVAKVLYFGDFSKYIIRDVVGDGFPVILRLEERYADYGQVGFFLFSRHDGDLLDAGTDPIKHAVMPSP